MKMEYLTDFLYEVGTLRKIARSHRQRFLTDDLSDNIASHSFRVCIIGYYLAVLEKAYIEKVLLMCLFHDISETRSGDRNWIHKKYTEVIEERIINDQLGKVLNGDQVTDLLNEYKERKTKESQIVKDADNLDQVFLIREYVWAGNREAMLWQKAKVQGSMLYTKSAKELYKSIYKRNPSDWANAID